MNTLGMVLLVVIGIIYLILLPIAKKKHHTKQLSEMKTFIDGLSIGDQVMMNSGIIGKIMKVDEALFHLEISKNTIIRVNQNAILGKYEEK